MARRALTPMSWMPANLQMEATMLEALQPLPVDRGHIITSAQNDIHVSHQVGSNGM